MGMVSHLRRLFSYDDWANREVIQACKTAGSPPKRSIGLLGHIVSAESLWWERIQGAQPTIAVWPDLSLEEIERRTKQMSARWRDLLQGADESTMDRAVSYKNSKGESWNSRIEDILLHVVMHSAYHRGQIAADLRAAGFTPAYTDFIHGVRQGMIE